MAHGYVSIVVLLIISARSVPTKGNMGPDSQKAREKAKARGKEIASIAASQDTTPENAQTRRNKLHYEPLKVKAQDKEERDKAKAKAVSNATIVASTATLPKSAGAKEKAKAKATDMATAPMQYSIKKTGTVHRRLPAMMPYVHSPSKRSVANRTQPRR